MNANGVRRWAGHAGIVGLTALNQGKTISLDTPVVARIVAHRDHDLIAIDRLECNSDFLHVKGSGTNDDASFIADGDLTKLIENLSRFIDLGIENLSGRMNANGELKRIDASRFGLTSKVHVDSFSYSASGRQLAGMIDIASSLTSDSRMVDVSSLTVSMQNFQADAPGWVIQEPELKINSTLQLDSVARKLTSPRSTLTGGSLSATVDNAVCQFDDSWRATVAGNASYKANLKQISHWKNLAIEMPANYIMGNLTGTATVSNRNGVSAASLDAQVEKFVIVGQNTSPDGQLMWVALLKEPLLKLAATGAYDGTIDKLMIDTSTVEVEGLSATAKGSLDACFTTCRIDLRGELACDWDTLVQRFGDGLKQNVQLSGKDHRPFSIKGSLASLSNETASSANVGVSNASFPSDERLVSAIRLIDGTPSATGGLSDLTGQAGIGWTSANVYGIVAGPGDVSMQLANGVCQFAPLDVTVNDGKLHVTPAIHLEQKPFLIVLPQEKVIDQVRLSPEMCRGWLKFVAPLLADSTQVDGKISFDMNGASLPLLAPMTGRLEGILAIHRAQVTPGPLGLQIIGSIDQIRSIIMRRQPGDPNDPGNPRVWIELPEQNVPVKLADGRAFHEGLTLLVKNVTVRTSGSVGSDETLSLIAEIDIKDEWLGNSKVLAGLKGQSIRIPIAGTLSRPKPDPRAFADLVRQIGGSAIEGLLKDKIGDKLDDIISNGLEKLLNRKK